MENAIIFETELNQTYGSLERLFGENFNHKKTIKIEKDVDENNQTKELGNCQLFWTEFRNPDTGETVEGKVYFSRDAIIIDYQKVLIICPGYVGDFVLQESAYADDFVNHGHVLVVLRHNALRVEGEDIKKYIHCPEKIEASRKIGQEYLGREENFSLCKANREVLTVLKALSVNANVHDVNIIGHSWGGRIALESILILQRENSEKARNLSEKIKNLIFLSPWLQTRLKNLAEKESWFELDKKAGYFKAMDTKEIMDSLKTTEKDIKNIQAEDLPKNLRIVGVQSVSDEYEEFDEQLGLQSGMINFFRRMKALENRGVIILGDLKVLPSFPDKYGDRKSQVHDYTHNSVRKWIWKLLKNEVKI